MSQLCRNKGVFFLSVFFFFVFIACSAAKADVSLIYVQAHLPEQWFRYNEVMSKYGGIWIGYTVANPGITIENGSERFIIEKACYFYKEDGEFILLGSVDKTGLYDKDGSLLKAVTEVSSDFIIAGISSPLVEKGILSPELILQSKTDTNLWRETDAFVGIDIDTTQDSLKVHYLF